MHLQYGHPNPLENTLVKFQYSLLFHGIKRSTKKAATRPKLLITPTVLNNIRRQLTLTNSFHVAFLAAFYSFLGKQICFHLHKKNSMNILTSVEDCDLHVHLLSWGVVMVVRWNKTIQFKQRTLLIPLLRVNDSPLCPLIALANAYAITREAGPYDPALMYRQGTNLVMLTYNKFLKKLQLTLKSAS